MRNNFIILLLTLVFISCQSAGDKTSSSIASDICTCFRPLVEMNEKVQTLIKSGKGNEAEKLLDEIGMLQQKGLECSSSLMEKFGADTQVDTKEISSVMSTTCPKIHREIGPALFDE